MFIMTTIIIVVTLYVFVARDKINTWGATDEEVNSTFPGDELLPSVHGQSTHAITIHAPPATIWQWLVQFGQGRGGFYSYDRLENLFGMDIHSADRILPEYQQLTVGDRIHFAKKGPIFIVAALELEQSLILRMPDQITLEFADSNSPDYFDTTWGFILNPVDDHTTRLIIRGRATSNSLTGRVTNEILGIISCIMEHKMLHGIKARAERSVALAST